MAFGDIVRTAWLDRERARLGLPSREQEAAARAKREQEAALQASNLETADVNRDLTRARLAALPAEQDLERRLREAQIRNYDEQPRTPAAPSSEFERFVALPPEEQAKVLQLRKQWGTADDSTRDRLTDTPVYKAGKLRGEFSREIKPYRAQQENFARLQAAVNDPSGANDVAIIFNYMKMLDPASVVREGEFATAETAGRSVPVSVWQMYNKAVKGERLTPSQRSEFYSSGLQQYRAGGHQASKTLVDQYRRLAAAQGLDPEDIVGGYFQLDLPSEPSPAVLPPPGAKAPDAAATGEPSRPPNVPASYRWDPSVRRWRP